MNAGVLNISHDDDNNTKFTFFFGISTVMSICVGSQVDSLRSICICRQSGRFTGKCLYM